MEAAVGPSLGACNSTYVTVNEAKAVLASSMLVIGANVSQVADAFNAIDALPKFAAVPVVVPSSFTVPCDRCETSVDPNKLDEPIAKLAPSRHYVCTGNVARSRKTCRRFARSGYCRYGSDCHFAHVEKFSILTPQLDIGVDEPVHQLLQSDEDESVDMTTFTPPVEEAAVGKLGEGLRLDDSTSGGNFDDENPSAGCYEDAEGAIFDSLKKGEEPSSKQMEKVEDEYVAEKLATFAKRALKHKREIVAMTHAMKNRLENMRVSMSLSRQ